MISAGQVNDSAQLPGSNMPSPQELENKFINYFYKTAKVKFQEFKAPVDETVFGTFINELEWSKRDSLFKTVPKGPKGRERDLVVRGESIIKRRSRNTEIPGIVMRLIEQDKIPFNNEEGQPILNPKALAKELLACVVVATDMVNEEFTATKIKSARKKALKQPGFYASLKDSVDFYNGLEDPALKKLALENSRGMLETFQFDINRGQVLKIAQDLGTIKIGARIVQEMLNNMTRELNESIFEIFTNVKLVQDNTYAFMAGGLTDDKKAEASIKASNAIAYKTSELRPQEK